MYRNDGTVDPVWTVDWYAHAVEAAADGVHFVRYGPWPGVARDAPLGAALDTEAVSFFANGRLLRTYSIRELVDKPDRLPRSVSHFQWLDKGQFDHVRSEQTITTLDGNQFVFDARTGAIVSESRVGRPVWWVIVGVATGVVGAVLGVWLGRRARRVKPIRHDL